MNCPVDCPAGYVCHCYHALPPSFFWVMVAAGLLGAGISEAAARIHLWRDGRKRARKRDSDTQAKPGDAKQGSASGE